MLPNRVETPSGAAFDHHARHYGVPRSYNEVLVAHVEHQDYGERPVVSMGVPDAREVAINCNEDRHDHHRERPEVIGQLGFIPASSEHRGDSSAEAQNEEGP